MEPARLRLELQGLALGCSGPRDSKRDSTKTMIGSLEIPKGSSRVEILGDSKKGTLGTRFPIKRSFSPTSKPILIGKQYGQPVNTVPCNFTIKQVGPVFRRKEDNTELIIYFYLTNGSKEESDREH